MNILSIHDLERHEGNAVIFPPFSLTVSAGNAVAIHTNMSVQKLLMDMLLGDLPILTGAIKVNDINISSSKKQYLQHIGVVALNDGLYERLTVKEYLVFYKKLYDSKIDLGQILQSIQLEEKKNTKIGKLSFSEKRRVHLGNLLLKPASLYILEEPDQNTDLETKRVLNRIVQQLLSKEKAVVMLTGNMESALAVTDNVYRLDGSGLYKLDVTADEAEKDVETEVVFQPVRFEKIPTKVNDKIVLFDPPEIDYIESGEGQSQLFIKGEVYPSMFTLNELEERLQPFGFFRCHRSYIVNLQKVREVVTWTRNSFTLILNDPNKSSVPLSKTKMAELKGMLGLK
ncbi:ABC transporter ATP-binding protein [Bacillus sp. UMB0899]|uniref:LytTR family transcriptional regulator DNA-binding domain-containing protein n=1 Tax=Metabacillus schmidteae TaxID=2730405 RepID=UPI000C809B85|nr:LytTR family transcriptional regulator DNA-binding domain-containing protein [Metabacillus schmidteae]PMC36731.1 ABC transporter ATP-binding protein [Bacillus sp. UMB0899]